MTDNFSWAWDCTPGETKADKLRFQSQSDETCSASTCSLLAGAANELERLDREITEAHGLLRECKLAFLGYPQEVRRTPLDLLRDLNRVTAKTPPPKEHAPE